MEVILNSAFVDHKKNMVRIGINHQFQSDDVIQKTIIQEIEVMYPDGITINENWDQVLPEHRLGKMEEHYYLEVPVGSNVIVILRQNRMDQKFPVNILQLLMCEWSGVTEYKMSDLYNPDQI